MSEYTEYYERRRQFIEAGARAGGARGMKEAERRWEGEQRKGKKR